MKPNFQAYDQPENFLEAVDQGEFALAYRFFLSKLGVCVTVKFRPGWNPDEYTPFGDQWWPDSGKLEITKWRRSDIQTLELDFEESSDIVNLLSKAELFALPSGSTKFDGHPTGLDGEILYAERLYKGSCDVVYREIHGSIPAKVARDMLISLLRTKTGESLTEGKLLPYTESLQESKIIPAMLYDGGGGGSISATLDRIVDLSKSEDDSVIWKQLFSKGLREALDEHLFQEMLNSNWQVESIDPYDVYQNPHTARVIARILDGSDDHRVSQVKVIFLVLEDGQWKLDNFPFGGSGVMLLMTPPAFKKSIWE